MVYINIVMCNSYHILGLGKLSQKNDDEIAEPRFLLVDLKHRLGDENR